METIKDPFVYEEKVLSSRFIGVLRPILGVDFAIDKAKVEELYPKATHYCYAFKKGSLEGSSDDGEPSRSAGLPMLQILRGSGLDEVALYVVRYFGGTKLGLPRLTKAYRDVAKGLVATCPRFVLEKGVKVDLLIPYPEYDRVVDALKRRKLDVSTPVFDEEIALSVLGGGKIVEEVLSRFPSVRKVGEVEEYIYSEKAS